MGEAERRHPEAVPVQRGAEGDGSLGASKMPGIEVVAVLVFGMAFFWQYLRNANVTALMGTLRIGIDADAVRLAYYSFALIVSAAAWAVSSRGRARVGGGFLAAYGVGLTVLTTGAMVFAQSFPVYVAGPVGVAALLLFATVPGLSATIWLRTALWVYRSNPMFSVLAINAYGAKKALAGLRNAVEGAASRREIACAMRMFFPRAQGGRSIPKPKLNFGLSVDKRLASVHGWQNLSVDIAWPEARLAMEYDSDTYHLDPRRRARDNDKRAVLEQMGWRVVPFSTKQFDSLAMSDDAFQRIGAVLGVRNRAGESRYDWQSRRSELTLRLWRLCEQGVRL